MIIRPATPADAPQMAALQNQIILIGGTTAHQHPRPPAVVAQAYITGADCICCHVAELDGVVVGFQAVGQHPDLPQGQGDIGSSVSVDVQGRGVGQRLFTATRAACLAAGLTRLNATIRADNVPGLAYYRGLGFTPYADDPEFALQNGQIVGRIHHQLDL